VDYLIVCVCMYNDERGVEEKRDDLLGLVCLLLLLFLAAPRRLRGSDTLFLLLLLLILLVLGRVGPRVWPVGQFCERELVCVVCVCV